MKRQAHKLPDICVYIVATLVIGVLIYAKQDYYVDELLSYTLSNNKAGWMEVVDGQWFDPISVYDEQLSVPRGDGYDYATVWANQEGDVHPPLYYALLHTICSLTPGNINRWQPAFINWIFAMLTLILVRRLLRLFLENGKACGRIDILVDVISLLYAVLPGILNNVSFYRMYVMAMFWVTWETWLAIRLVRDVDGGHHASWATWTLFLLANTLSALTHYYCVMFLVFLAGTLVMILVVRREWREMLWYLGTALASAVLAISIFPGMLTHIFEGYRGEQSFSNAASMTAEQYWGQCKKLFTGISRELCGGVLLFLLVAMVALSIYRIYRERMCAAALSGRVADRATRGIEPGPATWRRAAKVLLIVPCIAYYLLLGDIAVLVTTRYAFPIYAALFVGIVVLLWDTLAAVGRHRYTLMILLLVLVTISSYWQADWSYLYLEDPLRDQLESEYCGQRAIILYNAAWQCVELYRQIQYSGAVCFLTTEEYEMLGDLGLDEGENLLVYAADASDVPELARCLGMDVTYTEIGEHTDYTVYEITYK